MPPVGTARPAQLGQRSLENPGRKGSHFKQYSFITDSRFIDSPSFIHSHSFIPFLSILPSTSHSFIPFAFCEHPLCRLPRGGVRPTSCLPSKGSSSVVGSETQESPL